MAALESAVAEESFSLDPVAARLVAKRQKKVGGNGDSARGSKDSVMVSPVRSAVCIYACPDNSCNHPKMNGPSQNYTP